MLQSPAFDLPVNQIALARGNAYRLFSRLLRRGLTPEHLLLVKAIPELAEALPDPEVMQAGGPDSLAADHYHLFGLNIFPFESIFLDPANNLGGPVSEAVLEFYQGLGFRLFQDGESPDHLGQELALLAFLCGAEADAWEDGLVGVAQRMQRWQRRFLDEHLLCWLPGLSFAVQQQGKSFYSVLTDLALELALEHRASLAEERYSTGQPLQLPPLPPLLEDERKGLEDIARYLLTPAYSGFYLSRDDISRLAHGLGLPRGFGSRQDMLANLFRTAADHELLPQLTNDLLAILEAWIGFYMKYHQEENPLKMIAPAWLGRLRALQTLLDRLGSEAENTHH